MIAPIILLEIWTQEEIYKTPILGFSFWFIRLCLV